MIGYTFRGFVVPDYTIESILLYVEEGCDPFGFLTAVICNDLRAAIERADDEHMRNLPAIVAFLYNNVPSACWGSQERMDAWTAERTAKRR